MHSQLKKILLNLSFFSLFISAHNLYSYEILQETQKNTKLGYGDWFIDSDGELHFMQQWLRPHDIVFDIGAHVGEWSLHALDTEESIQLYSFEPLPTIFPDLQKKLSRHLNAQAFNIALSDQIGKANFYYYDETYDFSSLSGFYVREVLKSDHQPPKLIEVEQNTLTYFCSEHQIEKIDFLKIDAEGAEWIILKGAQSLIENNKIRAIQFEYGGCYIDAQTTLQDIYALLTENDYFVFRIKPNGLIQIHEWNNHLENFNLSNYLAIKKEDFLIRFPSFQNNPKY